MTSSFNNIDGHADSGLPPITSDHPHIERIGANCCISRRISIWRRGEVDKIRPLITLGSGVVIFDYVRLVVPHRNECESGGIRVGDRVMINVGSFISGEGGVTIGDEVLIGPHVKILSAGHQINGGAASVYRNPITYDAVNIAHGAWIGAGATILQGCSIGRGAVVAAGAVVTSNVPEYAVVAGIPASIIKYRKVDDHFAL